MALDIISKDEEEEIGYFRCSNGTYYEIMETIKSKRLKELLHKSFHTFTKDELTESYKLMKRSKVFKKNNEELFNLFEEAYLNNLTVIYS